MRAAALLLPFLTTTALASDSLTPNTHCGFIYDVVQVQDMTSSFDALWSEMAKQIRDVLQDVYSTHPLSRFGFVTFGDKPIDPLGYPSEYCAKTDVPLSRPDEDKMETLFSNYTNLAAGGGNDWSEASLEGLIRSLESATVGWREPDPMVRRLLVLVTDALPHRAPDAAELTGGDFVPFDLQAADLETDINYNCSGVEFPSFERVAKALLSFNAAVFIVAAPAGQYSDTGKFSPWRPIAMEGAKYRNEDGLALWYQDKFKEHGVHAVAVPVDARMEGYYEAFNKGLCQILKLQCPSPDDTTTGASTETAPFSTYEELTNPTRHSTAGETTETTGTTEKPTSTAPVATDWTFFPPSETSSTASTDSTTSTIETTTMGEITDWGRSTTGSTPPSSESTVTDWFDNSTISTTPSSSSSTTTPSSWSSEPSTPAEESTTEPPCEVTTAAESSEGCGDIDHCDGCHRPPHVAVKVIVSDDCAGGC